MKKSRTDFDHKALISLQKTRNIIGGKSVPQAIPIEIFWALCKKKYSLRTKTPKNLMDSGKFGNLTKSVA